MRNLIAITVLAFFAFSCGEEGIGFNVGKEFPVTIPIDAGDFPSTPFGGNPPAFTQSETYDLNDVNEFSDDLENLEEVLVNKVSYSISGVDSNEEIEVEELSIELSANGTDIGTLQITNRLPNNVLTDLPKGEISSLNKSELARVLKDGGTVNAEVTFDFAELPEGNFEFDFEFYFDVVVKIRDL
ncbi:hypothetical protein [Marinoscillum furvescens]|uniref:Uncharacterized protein n=1 Tax=Marinoscillum furvescens DSM 4134 TaxID=1122208 RepID=A0A3D9LJA7_MARFU|nr:hypothetical protein [Marinoscillum furvescens]REE05736.1 hypothetical protein C7460_101255 [Marinoscillum furvescens DSM 4134]